MLESVTAYLGFQNCRKGTRGSGAKDTTLNILQYVWHINIKVELRNADSTVVPKRFSTRTGLLK